MNFIRKLRLHGGIGSRRPVVRIADKIRLQKKLNKAQEAMAEHGLYDLSTKSPTYKI